MMLNKIKKKYIWLSALGVILIALVIWLIPSGNSAEGEVARCEQGLFETTVTTVGQIEATQTIDITIPDLLRERRLRIWGINIIDMVAEGTHVKKGDYVASLDPTNVDNEIKREQDEVDQGINAYESACLDSSLRLSGFRDAIISARDQLEDQKIKVEQSVYESKAFQRQAQIEYERAIRNVEQKKRDLTSQRIKLKVGIERIEEDIKEDSSRLKMLLGLKKQLRIEAPSDGMVIYAKNPWSGGKMKVGDEVNRHMVNIASLPDLSTLVSEAYVQEVDIKNVQIGQKVRIGVDAFPERIFTGTIIKMANIGQTIPGKQMNGFKITIEMDPYSEELYPGMTTNNQIITGVWEDAVMIPRPAVFSNDSIKYVYHKKGFSIEKQQVITGGENETHFRIAKGLLKGDKVLLIEPKEADELVLVKID